MEINEITIKEGEETTITEVIDKNSDVSSQMKSKIVIGDRAKVRHIFFLHDDVKDNFIEERTVIVGNGAKLESYYCYIGGREITLKTHFKISQNAHVEHNVLLFGKDEQKFNLNEIYEFQKKDSYGRFHIKAINSQQSTVNCIGNILIDSGAQKCNTYLDMQGFILGNLARSSMVPSLQIEANDVKAGHAATITQMNEEQLFYMQSRGLSKQQSTKLFLDGLFLSFTKDMNDKKIGSVILNSIHNLEYVSG